jgi:hypothetical protein
MKTKIHPNIHLKETERGYMIESSYRNGFTRKRNSISLKKTDDLKKDLSALEEAKKSVINHYEEMEYRAAVGVIVKDTEYTIRGMNCCAGKQGKDKEIIEIKISVQRKGKAAFTRSVSTYVRFVEVWHEATGILIAFHGLSSKPEEWIEAPSELYFMRLQKRLIAYKNTVQRNKLKTF